ncbi:MAG: hypothetical protein IH840_13455 [Candidatus Heimdallarchaeota archaeon]|nr:hypothetical protein [Candidatus Heimdallarchaeota archaeon]
MKSQLPLRSAIVEILREKDGVMLDGDLLIALKSKYGDLYFSAGEINKALIALETQGLVHVQTITRHKRRIMTIKDKDAIYMGVEED